MTIHVPWIWCSSLPCRVHRFLQMGPKSPWVYQVMVIHDWMIWDFGSPPWLRNLHWRFYVPWIPEKYPIDIPWISIGPWNPGCWFGLFFIFHNIWDNPSHWLIFFRGVETTNLCSLQYLQDDSDFNEKGTILVPWSELTGRCLSKDTVILVQTYFVLAVNSTHTYIYIYTYIYIHIHIHIYT